MMDIIYLNQIKKTLETFIRIAKRTLEDREKVSYSIGEDYDYCFYATLQTEYHGLMFIVDEEHGLTVTFLEGQEIEHCVCLASSDGLASINDVKNDIGSIFHLFVYDVQHLAERLEEKETTGFEYDFLEIYEDFIGLMCD